MVKERVRVKWRLWGIALVKWNCTICNKISSLKIKDKKNIAIYLIFEVVKTIPGEVPNL